MTKDEALKLALEALENNKQMHYYCEDTWYSCPQHEEGCANDSVGDECNCGADKANAEIDKVITAIKKALAQTQEPVAWMKRINMPGDDWDAYDFSVNQYGDFQTPLYTTPPQRIWVGLTNDELTDLFYNTNLGQQSAVAQAIALLKERNT